MIRMRISELTDSLPGTFIAPEGFEASAPIASVMTDSRVTAVSPAVFFALPTQRADGHDHVRSAIQAGAVVVVVERAVPDLDVPQIVVGDSWAALRELARCVVQRVGCRVVAITGSYGKTSVKDFSAAAMSVERCVAASKASFNNELGVPLTMLSVEQRTDVLIAEVGARAAGDIGMLSELLKPNVSVVTAVGPVHLETFGTIEGVAREKSRLVAALDPAGVAVLNGDDARVSEMGALASTTISVSAAGASADLRAENVHLDASGRVHADVQTPWGTTSLDLPIPGAHHLTNALLALAVAGGEGVPIEPAAAAIATAELSPSRANLQEVGGVSVLDDAYNASPPTMLGALRTLASLPCNGRRWAVLGVMAELGVHAVAEHRRIGAACVGIVDELVVVGEAALDIARGVGEQSDGPRVREVSDYLAAADLVANEIAGGDTVLFKGSRVATLDRAAAILRGRLEEGEAA